MASTAARPKPPDDADAWLDADCDGQSVVIEEGIKPGTDRARIRAAQAQSLRDALSGGYAPGGLHRPLDLTQEWFMLRVVVDYGGDYAGLGGGPLSAARESLRDLRSLLTAALAHVSS
jgi:hypothetical protein